MLSKYDKRITVERYRFVRREESDKKENIVKDNLLKDEIESAIRSFLNV